MKKPALTAIWMILIVLFHSCSTSREAVQDKKIKISLQGGVHYGGIIENTDMNVVPDVLVPAEASVDAFTGATQMGYNAGVHINKALRYNQIEVGLDYMYSAQTFNYIDAGNFYIGVRRLQVSQIMLPVTYNLLLFRNLHPNADLQLKTGFLFQRNFISSRDAGISLPDYSVHPLSFGPTIGITAFPFRFKNGNKLGIFMDAYRGSRIYEDYYNQPGFKMPGSGFVKFGVKYQFI